MIISSIFAPKIFCLEFLTSGNIGVDYYVCKIKVVPNQSESQQVKLLLLNNETAQNPP